MKITRRHLRRIIREAAAGGWVEQTPGDFPDSAWNFMQDWGWEPGESYGNVYEAWRRGEDWIVVTDDGGYYKVGAKYMVWSRGWVKASWSYDHMEKQVEAAKAGQDPPRDPGYQT